MLSALRDKTIVLGITGGIAAYKSCEVVSRLRKAGARVCVIMTKNACEFVAPLTFETLSGNPCVTDTFARPERWEVEHIALAKRADVFVIAPATANIIAKLAAGLADDMLSTTCLATRAPLLLAPAMNTGMWEAPATRQNMQTLLARGVVAVGPEGGPLACGDSGMGRMSEPADIVAACARLLGKTRDMAGLRVLVTAGPTREAIDPVRFLTNRSSGKMGYALACSALRRGADVTLVSGPVALPPPPGARMVMVESTRDLFEQMLRLCGDMDIIAQSAAPADFTPDRAAPQKIKKNADEGLTLALSPTLDAARAVGQRKRPGQTLIGFAAETESLLQNAAKKLEAKNLDMIVANDVTQPGAGFDADTNIATLVTRRGVESLPLMPKAGLADVIFDRALSLRKG